MLQLRLMEKRRELVRQDDVDALIDSPRYSDALAGGPLECSMCI